MNERLRDARLAAGYVSAAAAARRLGIPYGTYSGHENGQRGIRTDELTAYAKAFKTTVAWLAFGESAAEESISVPIYAIIHGFASPMTTVDNLGLIQMVRDGEEIARVLLEKLRMEKIVLEFSVPSDVVAIQVFGSEMIPFYSNGDCFLVRKNQRYNIEEYEQDDCFVILTNSSIVLSHEYISKSDGTWDIICHNSMVMRSRDIESVLEIFAIVKAGQVRRAGTVLADEFRAADRKGRAAEKRSK